MSTNTTMEGTAKTKTGVRRMVFAIVSILLEVLVIFLLIGALYQYAAWILVIIRILAVIMVLAIYGQNKTSTMKMPWIILILALPVLGVVLYLLIGINGVTHQMKRRYAAVNDRLLPLLPENRDHLEALRAEDRSAAGIAEYLTTWSGYPVWRNTDVVYYKDALDGLNAQLEAIKSAEKFIFMEYHAIEDKESWKWIEEALTERVSAGIEVRVFYDDMGSVGFITTDFAKKLRKLGIKCRIFNPFGPGLNVFLNNRDHRKITVVDGKVGFTGGYNLANEYFNITQPYGVWKDTGIRLEGDAVRALTVAFLENWNAVRGDGDNDEDFRRFLPVYDYKAVQTGFVQPYADNPLDDEQVGEEVYISMAEKAETYCYFATPYLIITDEMKHALTLAAKRGVDVRIVTPGIPDKKLVYNVTRSFYHPLVVAGVRIFEWTPGFCHCKMSVADDRLSTCGTINLDYRSLYHHFENGCFIYDPNVAMEIRADFEEMFQESREVTEDYRIRENSVKRFSELIIRLFAELL